MSKGKSNHREIEERWRKEWDERGVYSYDPSFYVDLDAVMEVVDFARGFSGQTDDAYEKEVKPWLEPLSFAVAGSRQEDGRVFQSFVVGVEDESS